MRCLNIRILQITYCSLNLEHLVLPSAPKTGSSLLFPLVIWNVITHHFRMFQEPDTYVSPSLSLFLSLFRWLFLYAGGGLYIFHPHTFFEHYPYHYLCKWLRLRQAVYRTSAPTPGLNDSFYLHRGSGRSLKLSGGKSVYLRGCCSSRAAREHSGVSGLHVNTHTHTHRLRKSQHHISTHTLKAFSSRKRLSEVLLIPSS